MDYVYFTKTLDHSFPLLVISMMVKGNEKSLEPCSFCICSGKKDTHWDQATLSLRPSSPRSAALFKSASLELDEYIYILNSGKDLMYSAQNVAHMRCSANCKIIFNLHKKSKQCSKKYTFPWDTVQNQTI